MCNTGSEVNAVRADAAAKLRQSGIAISDLGATADADVLGDGTAQLQQAVKLLVQWPAVMRNTSRAKNCVSKGIDIPKRLTFDMTARVTEQLPAELLIGFPLFRSMGRQEPVMSGGPLNDS